MKTLDELIYNCNSKISDVYGIDNKTLYNIIKFEFKEKNYNSMYTKEFIKEEINKFYKDYEELNPIIILQLNIYLYQKIRKNLKFKTKFDYFINKDKEIVCGNHNLYFHAIEDTIKVREELKKNRYFINPKYIK
jgi:hypothetical protein